MNFSSSEFDLIKSLHDVLLSKLPSITSPDLSLSFLILIGVCREFLTNPDYREE